MKTISKDVKRLNETIEAFLSVELLERGEIGDEKSVIELSAKLSRSIAKEFNGCSLYLAIDEEREKRNRKILDLKQNKGYTLERIANLLGLSTSTVHTVVVNKHLVTLTGEFNNAE